MRNECQISFVKRMVLLGKIALLSCVGFFLYLPSELGASLTIPPDSSEYAIGLANFFGCGQFGFTLNGVWYPSRYAPWFSLSCLTPAYFLSGGNALCFHWSILGFALSVQVLLYFLGKEVGLGRFAVIPPALLLFLPDFVFYSRVVMTEIPYTTLFAASMFAFVRFARVEKPSLRSCLLVGSLVTWFGMVRPTGLPMLLPFAVVFWQKAQSWKTRFWGLVLMGLPAVLYQGLNLIYNWLVFGLPFRNGYQYWMPVPCDLPQLMFNVSNLASNFPLFAREPIIQLTFLFVLISAIELIVTFRNRAEIRSEDSSRLHAFVFLLFQTVVLCVLYLGYYWADTRFFLAVSIVSVPLFLGSIHRILIGVSSWFRHCALILIAMACIFGFLHSPTRYGYMTAGRPIWLVKAQVAGSVLPEGSVLLQDGDPNVLEHFGIANRDIQLYPFFRAFDYVKHMVAPTSIRGKCAPPTNAHQRIIPELVTNGICRLPFPETFQENPERLKCFLKSGKRIFVEPGIVLQFETWNDFQRSLEEIGLETQLFGSWEVPGIEPNPIRHRFDQLVFPRFSMDSRPDIALSYYEVVQADPAHIQ